MVKEFRICPWCEHFIEYPIDERLIGFMDICPKCTTVLIIEDQDCNLRLATKEDKFCEVCVTVIEYKEGVIR